MLMRFRNLLKFLPFALSESHKFTEGNEITACRSLPVAVWLCHAMHN